MSIIGTFNSLLFKHSGVTGQIFHKNNHPTFFKSYQSVTDFSLRTAYVVSAPIFLSVLAIEALAMAVYHATKALTYSLAFNGLSECWSGLNLSLGDCFASLILSIAALASPVVNGVDLIGGAVSSMAQTATVNAYSL